MIWLCFGVLLWSTTHFVPVSARTFRAGLMERLGENGYKGIFSLLILGSIGLMVVGWRSSVPTRPSPNAEWVLVLANLVMLVAFVLFVASAIPSNLRRVLRHPQLTAVVLWASAHVVTNRDLRSLILFGGLGLWALLMILLVNRRDGDWKRPEAVSLLSELRLALVTAAAFALVFWLHGYLGISPFPL